MLNNIPIPLEMCIHSHMYSEWDEVVCGIFIYMGVGIENTRDEQHLN